MGHEVLMSVELGHVFVANVNDGKLIDLRIEPVGSDNQDVGRIYLAKVARVVPRLQAAFVNIGEDSDGFLGAREARTLLIDADRDTPIEDCVHDGDTVLVQVNRPADGDKGPQLTADISLPGRYAVLTPCRTKVSVSRSIEDDKERQRLIELAETVRDRLGIEGMDGLAGWVLRTAAEGVDNELLEKDMEMIAGIWTDILDKGDDNDPPCLLHQDLGGIERGLRDFIRPDTASVTIRGDAAFRMARSYCQKVMPQAEALIKQGESGEILFDRYDINGTIDKALNPRVDLPSGGWITIETTEAMTTIDVNSGSHSDPALAINLEAVAEIANQIPLRAVGGLIAIDFIDMSDEADGKKIEESLLAAFKDDRVPVRIGQMSNFGVIEMTRKRDRLSLLKSLPTGYFDDPDGEDD